MTTAIIGLLAGLVALAAWWLKRRKSPTGDERLDDLDREISALQIQIKHCRDRGDHAAADACLRLLRIKSSQLLGLCAGELGAHEPARGDGDPSSDKKVG